MARSEGDLSDWDERLGLAPLARAALWGGFAVLAASGAVLAARSETGSQRIAAALSGSSANAPVVAAERPIHALEGELRLLTETVRALTADRDRLLARLEALERSAEHTGSASPISATRRSAAQPGMEDASEASRTFAAARSTRSEFALDLGSESSLEALRGLWLVVKAQHGAVLEDLRPVVTIRDHSAAHRNCAWSLARSRTPPTPRASAP